MKFLKILPVVAISMFLMQAESAESAEKKIQKEQDARKHTIIRLTSHGDININRAEATIEPGTTVIWVNESRVTMELQFEGKQVTLACKSPVHFVVDEQGSFLSNRIPIGAVASLCFVEKGVFNYVARTALSARYEDWDRMKEFKGKIIVK